MSSLYINTSMKSWFIGKDLHLIAYLINRLILLIKSRLLCWFYPEGGGVYCWISRGGKIIKKGVNIKYLLISLKSLSILRTAWCSETLIFNVKYTIQCCKMNFAVFVFGIKREIKFIRGKRCRSLVFVLPFLLPNFLSSLLKSHTKMDFWWR